MTGGTGSPVGRGGRRRDPFEDYPHIPPHIRAWMEDDEGWQRVTQIVLDAIADTTNVITNTEVRELVEEAYRRAAEAEARRRDGGGAG